jgi:phosphatidylethanolamine-binding protein (PEBP) family uncharacterized protein
MKVQYGTKNVRNGQLPFTQEETASQPTVSEIPSEGCYTLVMIDPDAGGTPNGPRPGNSDRYYLHWIVVNISGGNIMSGDAIVPYNGPTPPPGTGFKNQHEYIFQLYEQPCGLTNGLTVKDRPNWSLQKFLQGKNLTLVATKSFVVPSP